MVSAIRLVPGGFLTPRGVFRPSISGAEDTPDGAGAGDAGGAGGAGDGAGAGLDIAALLADDAAADRTLTVAQLKPFLEQHTGTVAAKVRDDLRAERDAEDLARRTRDEQNSTRLSDKNWATDLDKRLDSSDPDVRAAALTEKQANNERYVRGLAVAYEDQSAETMVKALNAHMQPRLEHLKAQGEQGFIDALADPAFIQQYGGNELLAALKFGDEQGYQRGLIEAKAQADLDGRVLDASTGAPGAGGAGGAGGDAGKDLWEGIDRSKPGAAAEYQRRLNAQRTQAQRR